MIITSNIITLLIGVFLLIFNKRLGKFLDKNFRNLYGLEIEKITPWYPRLNVIVIGSLFTVGSILSLVDQITD